MVNTNPLNVGSDCGSITHTATDDGTSFNLTGATIGSDTACTITIDVTATTAGAKNNNAQNIGSTETGTGTDDAAATLEVTCNVNMVSGVTEYSDASYEACEILALGPDFIAAYGSNVSVNSGLEIDFLPGFMVEQGATLNANVCGQSLCMISDSPMPDGCHSCVTQICAIEATCCTVDFDADCLGMVSSECGLVCE